MVHLYSTFQNTWAPILEQKPQKRTLMVKSNGLKCWGVPGAANCINTEVVNINDFNRQTGT